MDISFSIDDIKRVAHVAHELSRPLDFSGPDAWRSAVNRTVKDLVGADSAGFILPVPNATPVFSEEHSKDAIGQFMETPIPLRADGRTVFEHILTRTPVALLEDTYSGATMPYLRSTYYNEYAGPNYAHDSFVALAPLPEVAPEAVGGIMLWHEHIHGRRFGQREKALLEAVYPALVAGMQAEVRWGRYRLGILEMLDDLHEAALVVDDSGVVAHETRTLAQLLELEPEGEDLRARMLRAVAGCRISGGAATASVSTVSATYRITSTVLSSPSPRSRSLTIVSIVRTSLRLQSEVDLRESFGITPAERRVAAHVVSGNSAQAIADSLHLSPHTVRRHIESLLAKTGSPSKTALAMKLLE